MVREAQRVSQPSVDDQRAGALAAVQRTGAGVAVSGISKVFDAGPLTKTGGPLDVAIQGDGFLEVTMPDGGSAYVRGGSLTVTKDGLLATAAGYPLKPAISVPANAQSISIAADGQVQITLPNQPTPFDAGQLQFVRFANPGQLLANGDGMYIASDAAGDPIVSQPGVDGAGTLAQGFLEGSNVKMVDEMVNLMLAQRSYEASVKVVQAADEMLGMVNNLRK
jgi:flagellar basal-body rod protein FlgG